MYSKTYSFPEFLWFTFILKHGRINSLEASFCEFARQFESFDRLHILFVSQGEWLHVCAIVVILGLIKITSKEKTKVG